MPGDVSELAILYQNLKNTHNPTNYTTTPMRGDVSELAILYQNLGDVYNPPPHQSVVMFLNLQSFIKTFNTVNNINFPYITSKKKLHASQKKNNYFSLPVPKTLAVNTCLCLISL
jgi:hypothetical protein